MDATREETQRWYHKVRWLNRRALQLKQFPICAWCLEKGDVEPATVADHITPHRGNEMAFFTGALQSLCKQCHDRGKQQLEVRGFTSDIDASGWPSDPGHPVNQLKGAGGLAKS
jgi:5-methylcytosine-specific restriction enzyme A